MGLLDINMNTPEGEGFNSALMAAAQALLTPRAQGGGMGAAFGAFPKAIEHAQLQSQRARMLGLQEKQMGQQGQRMDFDMAQAQRKTLAEQVAAQNRAAFLQKFQSNGGKITPDMIPEALSGGIKPDDLKNLAGSENWGRTKLEFHNGVGVDPYEGKPMVTVPDVNKPFTPTIGADGQVSATANDPYQVFATRTAKAGASNQTVSNYVLPATPGQKKADEKFGVDFVEFATGGYADVMKQLDQLREASRTLKSGTQISGAVMGNLPDAVLAATNPQAVATKEAIQEVAQRNLRLVLGAQFTEKEGERLIARVFNPRLDEKENAKRVDRLIKQIGEAAQAKLAASQYFQQHGSLTGWAGRLPSLSDFEPDFVKKDSGATGGWSATEVK